MKKTIVHASDDKAWNNPKYRAIFFQVLVLSALIATFNWLLQNAMHNYEVRGITSGFDFLRQTARFEVDFTVIDFADSDSNGRVFWVGYTNTLLVSVFAIIFATLIGVVMGVARLSKNWLIAKLAMMYVEVFRNIPLLLQIFFWYFSVLGALPKIRQAMKNGWFNDSVFFSNRGLTVPKPVWESGAVWVFVAFVLGMIIALGYRYFAKKQQERTGKILPIFSVMLAIIIAVPTLVFFIMGSPLSFDYPTPSRFNLKGGMTLTIEFVALLFALSVYAGAFIAEIVRAGIEAVPHGQTEAAHSLAISPAQTLRLVIIPQALRVIIPPLASQYLNLAKNSSLAAAIAYPELVSLFAGTVLTNTGQSLECIAIVMLAYLSISLTIAAFMNWYNTRMALVER